MKSGLFFESLYKVTSSGLWRSLISLERRREGGGREEGGREGGREEGGREGGSGECRERRI